MRTPAIGGSTGFSISFLVGPDGTSDPLAALGNPPGAGFVIPRATNRGPARVEIAHPGAADAGGTTPVCVSG